jgi:diadenosine tetraphosphate (Ap4A) HIT family hydrolase
MKKGCPFCEKNQETYNRILEWTDDFYILSDIGPIVPGHLLLIPRQHIPCLATLDKELEKPFFVLKEKIISFLRKNYGQPIIFEHGVTGQTVFHAHIHFIPTNEPLLDKILGKVEARKIESLQDIRRYYKKDGSYLYLEEGSRKYIVPRPTVLPRFLRIVIAELLGVPERENWAKVTDGQKILKEVKKKWDS